MGLRQGIRSGNYETGGLEYREKTGLSGLLALYAAGSGGLECLEKTGLSG